MVRLIIGLLFGILIVYYTLLQPKEVKQEPLGFAPSIITVEELPDIGATE
jgi:hypothetical protein